MKRGAPSSGRPPLRRTRMKRGPSRRSLNRKLAATLYLRFLHSRPCCVRGSAGPCEGRIEQSHARNINGPTGMGRKESDFASVPKCTRHHRLWETHAGPFAGWSKEARRRWMVAAIVVEHVAFELEGGVIP